MAVYLDYCASTPIDRRVLDAMVDVYQNTFGNADSRTHIFGARAKEAVEHSRRVIADLLHIDKAEVIFTSGATESDNMAILGLMAYGEESHKKHLVTTAIEHKAVLEPMHFLEKRGFEVDYVYPQSNGCVSPEAVLSKVRSDTLLVSVMHVNNETGVIQPVEQIGDALDKTNVFFHVDAAQSFGKLNDVLRKTKYNMLSISGHKIHGPQGVGVLILRRKQYKRPPIQPLFLGGQQEYGFRPGTTPVPLVVGMARAATLISDEYLELQDQLIAQKQRLLEAFSPFKFHVNGEMRDTLPNIINISFDGVDAEALFTALKGDYAISNGSACTSGSYKPSYVLKAMGLDDGRISEALRISWWNEAIDPTELVAYISSII